MACYGDSFTFFMYICIYIHAFNSYAISMSKNKIVHYRDMIERNTGFQISQRQITGQFHSITVLFLVYLFGCLPDNPEASCEQSNNRETSQTNAHTQA
jgi:hypothetical protein